MIATAARERFRAFPLDGALMFFQPSTGLSVRLENEGTASLRRRAPRVVMFGITNSCNLRCSFCSRDTARASDWTVPTALEMLQGLARAGTLEVAFGGGEPFAFRGFAELVSELHASTALALHVTTNGTLLDPRGFAPFVGRFGQVRVSIYEGERWRVAARTLSDAGQLWGANVLVDEARLGALPHLLAELAALGCHDASILNYVGGDATLQLDAAGRRRLAAILSDAPLTCRVSVCFGNTLPIPRLFEGVDDSGDCGAGYDFLSLTPDRRVHSCSFRDSSVVAQAAEDVLRIWRERQDYLARATRRIGCSRDANRLATLSTRRNWSEHDAGRRRTDQTAKIWRAFSGNNSGECILVGKFDSRQDAERYLTELQRGYEPDGDYSEQWRALFDTEQVLLSSTRDNGEIWGQAPQSLVAVGKSVIAVGYDSGDAFPELRALTWKRAGYVVPGGIHLHESASLLAAIRARDAQEVRALETEATRAPFPCETHPHGSVLFVRIPEATSSKGGTFAERAQLLERLAAGRPLGAELVDEWNPTEFTQAKQRLGTDLDTTPRLQVLFHGPDHYAHAQRFAEQASEASAHAVKNCVLLSGVARRKRLAVLALRQGGYVTALDATELDVYAFYWHLEPPRQKGKKAPPAPVLDQAALARGLEAAIGVPIVLEPGPTWRQGVRAHVRSAHPERVLAAMASTADQFGMQINLGVSEVDALSFTLRRLLSDVTAASR